MPSPTLLVPTFLCEFGDYLYSCIGSESASMSPNYKIYRSLDGFAWSHVYTFPNVDIRVSSVVVFDGSLYIATSQGGEPPNLYSSANGTDWAVAYTFSSDSDDLYIKLGVFASKLYVTAQKGSDGSLNIYSSSNGTDWSFDQVLSDLAYLTSDGDFHIESPQAFLIPAFSDGNGALLGYLASQYTITTHISPSGAGTVTLTPAGGSYDPDTEVEISATSNAGYAFEKWTGDSTSIDPTDSLIMDENKDVTAVFIAPAYYEWTEKIKFPGSFQELSETSSESGTVTGQIVPLDNSPNQSFQVDLSVDDSVITLNLFIYYNEIAGYWIMTVMDSEGNILVDPVPLITGKYPAGNLLRQHAYLKIGSAYIIPTNDASGDYPNDTNLGTDFLLVWGDTPS